MWRPSRNMHVNMNDNNGMESRTCCLYSSALCLDRTVIGRANCVMVSCRRSADRRARETVADDDDNIIASSSSCCCC